MDEGSISFTALCKQEGAWWIGWIGELPGGNCQEKTRDDLIHSLGCAVRELMRLNLRHAKAAAGVDFSEIVLERVLEPSVRLGVTDVRQSDRSRSIGGVTGSGLGHGAMMRRDLIRLLLQSGCRLVEEGALCSWWERPSIGGRSAVPRQTEIVDRLAHKICKDLGVEPPQ